MLLQREFTNRSVLKPFLNHHRSSDTHRKSYTDLSGATATESWRSNANNFNVGIVFRF